MNPVMELESVVRATGETIEDAVVRGTIPFSRGLVGLHGTYADLDDQGMVKKETFFWYTGFLIELDGRWYMLTAGHCLEEFNKAAVHPKLRLSEVALASGFGSLGSSVVAEPFYHYADAPRHAVFKKSKGLDYAWMEIREYYRNFLELDGAQPIPLTDLSQPAKGEIKGYIIVGFPEEFVQKNPSLPGDAAPATGLVERVIISANTMDPVPAELANSAELWFVARLNNAPLKSAVGLSGAPIIEIAVDGDEVNFRLVALQSCWRHERRIVFGCLAGSFLPMVLDEIQQQQG